MTFESAMGGGSPRAAFLRQRPWLWLVVPLIYFGLVLLRRTVLLPNINTDTASAIWPTSAILATGLLLMPQRQRRWAVVLSVIGALVISTFASPVRAWLGLAEGLALAYLGRVLCGPKPNFSEGRTLFIFLVGAVLPTNLISGALVYALSLPFGPPTTVQLAVNWFIGHALGAAIFVPALTIILDQRRFRSLRGSAWELGASLALLSAVAGVLFFRRDPVLWFMIFPVLMLVAFRHGPLGSALGGVILSLLALVEIYGPWSPDDPGDYIAWMQFFIVVAFLSTLPAAGAVASYARTRSLLARRSLTARLARRRADAASSAKGEFLANMSHEIRTPLNGVIGLADAMSRTDLTSQQREMLQMILSSGKALTGLLSDALDLARADSGALALANEPFDVRTSIYEAAFLFESLAKEKGLAFQVDFDVDPPGAALGDALRLRQIVSNLIANAVKFTAQGSVTVQVSLKRRPDGRARLTVVVRDTGPGFDAAVKARLFSRFEQGDSSVTRRFGGTGLGLAIAQRLAGMMGGAIECDAVPGKGAVFSFTAALDLAAGPVVADRSGPGPGPLASMGAADTGLVSVLLAEDNLINQKVVQAMLTGLAHLTVVNDGEAAVEAVRTQTFDAILMDTHMPRMDGLTAIRAIRAEEIARGVGRTPIISLTADAMAAQVSAALAAGADLHVAKPITAANLIGALRSAVQPPAAGPEARPEAKAS
ncbi:MAG: hypothetical protein B7Y99_02200 [Caulobacterales bacterium 32-69-10]|nr:MAG: hypothetical protein B7Y99_02200 [Caulobacterales bacterium 32-69-10]